MYVYIGKNSIYTIYSFKHPLGFFGTLAPLDKGGLLCQSLSIHIGMTSKLAILCV